MIGIDDKLISDRILEKQFVCNLTACKGACCIEGDAGAPLEDDETKLLDKLFPKIKKHMRKEGIDAVISQGKWITAKDGELETPLINGAECAYVIFEKNGTAKCAIEKAYEKGEISFKKPISCHLYPIRIKKTKTGYILNYDEWEICKPACELGKQLNVKVYSFLKEPIERKFGKIFYKKLIEADHLNSQKVHK